MCTINVNTYYPIIAILPHCELKSSRASKRSLIFNDDEEEWKFSEKALLKSGGGKLQRRTGQSTCLNRKLKERSTPSAPSQSSGEASSGSDESTTLCAICNQRDPAPQ